MDNWGKERRKINPREEANIFSLLSFWSWSYINNLIFTCIGTLYEFSETAYEKTSKRKICTRWSKAAGRKNVATKRKKRWNKCHSIYRLMWKRFGKRYVTLGLITITWSQIYSILNPYGMSRLISYFDKSQTKITRTDAEYSAAIVVFLNIASFVFLQNFQIIEFNFALKMQASLKSLMYRKILRLSPEAFSSTSLGNVVTILTKDIYTIETSSWLVMDIIIAAAKSVTVSYLLWSKLGEHCLYRDRTGAAYISRYLTKMRLEVGRKADERLQIMQETLSAIKIIKIYTWEHFFYEKNNRGTKERNGGYDEIILSDSRDHTDRRTSQEGTSLGEMIPYNICKIAEFKASFIRLNALLQAKEVETCPCAKTKREENGNVNPSFEPDDESNKTEKNRIDNMNLSFELTNGVKIKDKNAKNEKNAVDKLKPFIEVENGCVKIVDKEILKDINLDIKGPNLTLVTGTVGSGKSSLLKTILRDYSLSEGTLRINGTVSYASQEPWLFPSSVKQNIVFGEDYDASRYEEVVKVCALKYDFTLLESGDETLVADRGLNLSKGQQLRVNLARAMYKNSDIYLIDDALTALDGHVQDFIFENAIKTFLRDKICILVTQNATHLKKADNVVVMKKGRVVFSGKPEDIYKSNLTDLIESQVEKSSGKAKKTKEEQVALLETEQQFTKKKVYQEVQKTGKVEMSVYKSYLKFGGGILAVSAIIVLYILSQTCESSADKLITKIDLQQEVLDLKENSTVNATYYEETVSKKDTSFALYATMVILHVVLNLVKYYALLKFCRNASIHIHQAMSSRVVAAAMSFFDTHFIGNILNRFSHDLNNIDENIPWLLPGLINVIFSCIGGIVLVASVNWIFLIPSCVFLVLMVCLRMVYISTGRSLKRLGAAAKSPLVGHINSSLEGLTTIRAFKAEPILKDEFDRHQDLYTSAHLTHLYTTTAFGFYMEFFSSIFTILVIVRFLFFEHDLSAGNVGLALTQVSVLTGHIRWGIKQWAYLENHMTSVERTLEYTTIKQEDASGEEVRDWPRDGAITYQDVVLKYEKAKEPVLKGISFSVKPGQKIGIVGRTGAGKSSILSTLFRLYEYEGNIWIDDVDISTVTLTCLRRSIAIIPQDPILFTGTIRSNIDPDKKYTDAVIWKAIDQVKIKHLITSLDVEVKEGGSHFSVGQKQLICLARAAIDKFKIVVLDEATANMDAVTDKMLHDVIDELFSQCTMLMIAHRLHSVLNCDKVMVLDNGRIVEFDNPRVLLEDEDSIFCSMCRTTELES
ncbi:hypothetical protein NQ318_012189 [Aromia moschata]|uniref:Multidrug resistance-associated protein lethal(2)03659 n=1 Tax=Aromia moschata TaxID=1265417 RepID=A0AAV8YZG8_9CUCU|nr:hypothetical protein NQ318_012189 [Aromia moschata]